MSQVSDVAYRRLKSMIYRGALGPGARLVERDLARELGVSRIPVREGLARLETEGLVRSVPNSATFVEDLLPRDVLEIFSMRLLLEPYAAGLAAAAPVKARERMGAQLRKLCVQMDERVSTGSWDAVEDTDFEFHLAIVRAANHRRLLRAYEGAHIRIVRVVAAKAHAQVARASTAAAEHALITRYLQEGKPGLAERAARRHVKRAVSVIERTYGIRV
jgi:DNA-binding GntR family transcriptional regulator